MLLAIPSPRASTPQLPAPESDMTGSFAELSMGLARRSVLTPTTRGKTTVATQIRLPSARCDAKTLPTNHCPHLQEFLLRIAPE